jgi:Domain of unknown function (DUF4365)
VDISQQKEQFSLTYTRAVVTTAGYSLYRPEVDDDSIDLGIAARGGDIIVSPRLELQLKCTSRSILGSDQINYPLNIKNYNDLRINAFIPRILVLVLVPENIIDWLKQTEDELCLRYCAYWVSLRGMLPTENRTNVTINISRQNQFTVEALQGIIQRISSGDTP